MIDLVQIVLGWPWWFRLLRRSPGRALVVAIAPVTALVVLIAGIWWLDDPRLDVLLFAVVVPALAAVCVWADRTAPEPSRESPAGPDPWTPPSAEEVRRVIGGAAPGEPGE